MYNLEDNFHIAKSNGRLDELYGLIANAKSLDDLAEKFQLDDVLPYYTLKDLKLESERLYLEYK